MARFFTYFNGVTKFILMTALKFISFWTRTQGLSNLALLQDESYQVKLLAVAIWLSKSMKIAIDSFFQKTHPEKTQ